MGARKPKRRPGAGARGGEGGGARDAQDARGGGHRYDPEPRRETGEALHRSGPTQAAFVRPWDVGHVTLGAWPRQHAAEGPRGSSAGP